MEGTPFLYFFEENVPLFLSMPFLDNSNYQL